MSKVEQKRRFYKSLEAKSLRGRNMSHLLADMLTRSASSPFFLFLNAILFVVWLGVNLGHFFPIPTFDPYPFGMLTTIVSLEAIFLSIFVLISQQRASHIATLREEVHLRINLMAEEEITKALELLVEMRQKMGITREDPELKEMLERVDTPYIEKLITDQIEHANKPIMAQLAKEFPEILNKVENAPVRWVEKIITNEHSGEEKKPTS